MTDITDADLVRMLCLAKGAARARLDNGWAGPYADDVRALVAALKEARAGGGVTSAVPPASRP